MLVVVRIVMTLSWWIGGEHFGVKHVSYLGYNLRNNMCCMCNVGNIYIYTHTFICVGRDDDSYSS